MKKWFLLFCVFAIGFGAKADQGKIVGERIFYRKEVPATIRGKMPRGGRTSFFGLTRIGTTKLALHLYWFARAKDSTAEDVTQPHRVLNIFRDEERGATHRYSLVNSVALDDIYYDDADFDHWSNFHTIGMSWLWLDSENGRIPTIKIDAISSDALYYYGINVLVVFARGLSNASFVQSFGYGTNNNAEYWQSLFDERDERGFLVVKTTFSANSDIPTEVLKLRWNGRKFAPLDR